MKAVFQPIDFFESLPQFTLGALAVVNVGRQDIPTDNATLCVTKRTNSHVEPAVDAIGSTATILKLKRLPSFKRALPGVDRGKNVIRMKSVACRPILQFLGRLSEKLQNLAVDEFDLTSRGHDGNLARNAVDDQAEALLLDHGLVQQALRQRLR